ncbi:MAG: neutral zinc metallopeptidase [Bacteroidota bacterium]
MRWQGRKKSTNIEDRRRGGGAVRTGAGVSIGAIVIYLLVTLLGGDGSQVLSQLGQDGASTTAPAPGGTAQGGEDELAEFVSVVLKDTEDIWDVLFREQLQRSYDEPVLVLFSQQVQSRCGTASSATGPFYCPGDEKLYIDLSFYQELKNRFRAPGDFAMAFVVAHEVAHHVQQELGIMNEVHAQRSRLSQAQNNELSVRLELQADFLAGVWAHHTHKMKGVLEEGDIEEAIRVTEAIGDDAIQMQSQGYVVPESFTHGSSEQRKRWFAKGLRSGDLRQGDTFAIPASQL